MVKRLIANKATLDFTILHQTPHGSHEDYIESTNTDLMQYHVDTYNYDEAGDNKIPLEGIRNFVTMNTYLNDEYSGGNIN